ncbi:cold shock domain-containing protein [Rugosimonospora acidiphila]|uniref:Cold shock domain-containing protein n=1 Tax=Rugosimonospora acidiphila TaxID=556531 RepID=A0ABP9STM6_9ACTN
MATGKVVRFDEGRGYGFIAPDDGGDDVFVHANELTDRGVRVSTGARVQFNVIDGGRGLKAYDVEVLDAPPVPVGAPAAATVVAPREQASAPSERQSPDDELCEIFSEAEFTSRVTDVLLDGGPQLTGAQILELRARLLKFAKQNGWVD